MLKGGMPSGGHSLSKRRRFAFLRIALVRTCRGRTDFFSRGFHWLLGGGFGESSEDESDSQSLSCDDGPLETPDDDFDETDELDELERRDDSSSLSSSLRPFQDSRGIRRSFTSLFAVLARVTRVGGNSLNVDRSSNGISRELVSVRMYPP